MELFQWRRLIVYSSAWRFASAVRQCRCTTAVISIMRCDPGSAGYSQVVSVSVSVSVSVQKGRVLLIGCVWWSGGVGGMACCSVSCTCRRIHGDIFPTAAVEYTAGSNTGQDRAKQCQPRESAAARWNEDVNQDEKIRIPNTITMLISKWMIRFLRKWFQRYFDVLPVQCGSVRYFY